MQHSEERLLGPAPLHHGGFLLRRIIVPWTQLGGSLATRVSFCCTHIREKRKKKLTVAGSLQGKKEITYSFIPRTTAHWSHLYTFYQHASIFKSNNFLLPCWIRARTRMYWKSWWFKRVHSHPDCAFSCCSTSNDWLSWAPSPHYIKWFWGGHLLWRTGWQSAIWDHCDEILMFNTWQ